MSDRIKKNADFYVVGGTMRPDAPSYIQRKADKELYECTLAGDFCYVLTPRQMGKSSLMARTACRLKKEKVRTVIVDLTQIGTEKEKESADRWYYGIAYRTVRELDMKIKLSDWWQEREKLPALQRLTEFFEDVLLPGTKEPVVIFVDEIDTTIALPFTDDFFAAIRACYNARANKGEYRRLNFVLLGVANPSDLIKDTQRTPFNIGHGIHLTDFTLAEAKPLSLGLCADPAQGEKMLARILHWTGGHPYLTQKLCRIVVGEKLAVYSDEVIDDLVEKNFLSPGANRQEPNLKFVSDRLLQDRKNSRKRLKLYRRVYREKPVLDDPLSPTHTSLKLSGLVLAGTEQILSIRNRIYERTFTEEWIREIIPTDWNRNIVFTAFAVLVIGFIIVHTLILPKVYIEVIRLAQKDVPTDAYNNLKVIPFYKTTADNLFADYWHRRALRAERQENRDEALIYHLKALKVKESKVRRSDAGQVIGDDYKNLIVTYQHNSRVCAVAFSPDGKTVLTGSDDGTARLWEAATGESVPPPMKHGRRVSSVSFSPDGKTVLTGCYDGAARLWEAATGKAVFPLMMHGSRVNSVAFSSDGKTVLTGGSDGTARLWDTVTGKIVAHTLKNVDSVVSVAFSPDGKIVLTGSFDGTAQLWEAATGKAVAPTIKHGSAVFSVDFNPDGKTVLTGSYDGTVRLWKVATGKPVTHTLKHFDSVSSVVFSPDGKTVLTGSFDGARLWEAATEKPVAYTMKYGRRVSSVAFSPDGKTVLTGSYDGTARLWEAVTRKPVPPYIKHGSRVSSVTFSPDGKIVLTGSYDGTARLWQAAMGKPVVPIMKHGSWVYSVAFSPDRKTVLTGSYDGTVRLWEAATGKPVSPIIKHGSWVSSVAFSPDGKAVLTGSLTGARLWKAATGEELVTPMKHGAIVNSVAFSPDGKTVLTGSYDGTVRLWEAATGKSLSIDMIHYTRVNSVTFSPDGKTVITGSQDGTVRLWQAATGKPVTLPMKYGESINSVAFSPDGKTIMAATFFWIHQSMMADGEIKPKGSRLLLGRWAGAYRFLDDKGDHMQVAVYLTGDSIKIINLRFDKPDAPPIQGDPEELLKEWQKKLALRLDEKTGKIEPIYPLPSEKDISPSPRSTILE